MVAGESNESMKDPDRRPAKLEALHREILDAGDWVLAIIVLWNSAFHASRSPSIR
jgi:hypothetical protein